MGEQLRSVSPGTVVNSQFVKPGRFMPRVLGRIRDVAARLKKLRLARPKGMKSNAAVRQLTAAHKAFQKSLDSHPVIAGVYGLPEIKAAYEAGRRVTPEEVERIEDALKLPKNARLPKDRKTTVAERMVWLNAVYEATNRSLGFGRVIKSKNLPDHLRELFHKAHKLGTILHFLPSWQKGAGDALDPTRWYDDTMHPLHVAWHEHFAKSHDDPFWGRLTADKSRLDDRGGRPIHEYAPAQAVANVITGFTSPGLTPEANGLLAHRIIKPAVAAARKAGTEQWIEHLPEQQDDDFAQWMAATGAEHPNTTPEDHVGLVNWAKKFYADRPEAKKNPRYKGRTIKLVNGVPVATPDKGAELKLKFFSPEARETYLRAKKSDITTVNDVPIPDENGRLQPKEWSTNESVGDSIRRLKKILEHVRANDPHVKGLPAGPSRAHAEMSAVGRWILTHHPVAEVEALRGGELNDLGFRRGQDEQYGARALGPKVGEFVPGLSGPEHAHTHTQDMHEARKAEVVQGTAAFGGKYNDERVVSYNDMKRQYLFAAANYVIAHLKTHHPDHPILKLDNNTRAVQALDWIAQKSLIDKDGLLDFHSTEPQVGGKNTDYVSSANAILRPKYGRNVFSPSGRREAYADKPPKTGLRIREDQDFERLARGDTPDRDHDSLIGAADGVLLPEEDQHHLGVMADRAEEVGHPNARLLRAAYNRRALSSGPGMPPAWALDRTESFSRHGDGRVLPTEEVDRGDHDHHEWDNHHLEHNRGRWWLVSYLRPSSAPFSRVAILRTRVYSHADLHNLLVDHPRELRDGLSRAAHRTGAALAARPYEPGFRALPADRDLTTEGERVSPDTRLARGDVYDETHESLVRAADVAGDLPEQDQHMTGVLADRAEEIGHPNAVILRAAYDRRDHPSLTAYASWRGDYGVPAFRGSTDDDTPYRDRYQIQRAHGDYFLNLWHRQSGDGVIRARVRVPIRSIADLRAVMAGHHPNLVGHLVHSAREMSEDAATAEPTPYDRPAPLPETHAERPGRLARKAERPDHVAYVSPSTRENSTFEQAAVGVRSPEMDSLAHDAMTQPTVRAVHRGIGFWTDGAEESAAIHVGDPSFLAKAAIGLGKKYRQKAVLTFLADPAGKDVRHVIVVPDTDPRVIHEHMMRHGIEYKTLIPVSGGTRIDAVDGGGEMTPEFEGYAREAGALHHEVHHGTADFIGRERYGE